MQQLELKTLIGRLSPELRQGLETAAALCVKRSHRAVELEHWFLQLCKEPGSCMARNHQYSAVVPADNCG